MGRQKDREGLRKLMAFILGRRPDEFGLVLDEQGFVRIKDLIKAITEEQGWGYVRKSHIREVLMTSAEPYFVMDEDRIKAVDDDKLLSFGEETTPPKRLYQCVRRRAYPVVFKEGIRTSGKRQIFLTTTEDLARRMGKRRDSDPVMLTVQAEKAFKAGLRFFKQGELIYATDFIPPDCFVGPPLPREKKKEAPKKGEERLETQGQLPGSVLFDPSRSEALYRQRTKGKQPRKEVGWKEDVRKLRRVRKKRGAKQSKS
jgi:putative RNA 2'-phosphotransferase